MNGPGRCQKLDALYAAKLRKSRPRIGSKWYLDEVFLRMNGVSIIYGGVWTRMARLRASSYR